MLHTTNTAVHNAHVVTRECDSALFGRGPMWSRSVISRSLTAVFYIARESQLLYNAESDTLNSFSGEFLGEFVVGIIISWC